MQSEKFDELACRFQRGDEQAFVDLLLATQREVRIFVSVYASNAEMVDEVVQESFVICYETIHKYEPRGTFLSWLKGIARNVLRKELRQRSRQVALDGDELDKVLSEQSLASLRQCDVEESRLERLQQCLERLDESRRELIQRRYAGNVSIKALAEFYGRTESWVAVSLFRIRESLRLCLAGGGELR